MKNQKTYLEHANITTSRIEDSLKFFSIIFPKFYIRNEGETDNGKWCHFGNEYFYIALNQRKDRAKVSINYDKNGINHLGFVVQNLKEIGIQLKKLDYERSYPIVKHPFRRREYFYDSDGNDYELIEYFSDKNEERNDYSD